MTSALRRVLLAHMGKRWDAVSSTKARTGAHLRVARFLRFQNQRCSLSQNLGFGPRGRHQDWSREDNPLLLSSQLHALPGAGEEGEPPGVFLGSRFPFTESAWHTPGAKIQVIDRTMLPSHRQLSWHASEAQRGPVAQLGSSEARIQTRSSPRVSRARRVGRAGASRRIHLSIWKDWEDFRRGGRSRVSPPRHLLCPRLSSDLTGLY